MLRTKFILWMALSIVCSVGLSAADERKLMVLEENSAELIHLGDDTTEVFVANPDIADVQLNSPRVAYVYGRKAGKTTVFATDSKGKQLLNFDVEVVQNISGLKQMIKAVLPDEDLNIHATPLGLILDGTVSSPKVSRDIQDIASEYVGKEGKVINHLAVSGSTQVYLRVKIAEVKRTVLQDMGINWDAQFKSAHNNFTFGLVQGRVPLTTSGNFARAISPNALPGIGVKGSANSRVNVNSLLDALDREGLATVLAEPNLVAVSGETASFLSGGEYPYPVPQDSNIAIQFKQFGISLGFTPTVLSSGEINLRVRPEVSSLDNSQKLTIATAFGAAEIPSIVTRRAETTVVLSSGQSLAIAGLFSSSMSNTIDSMPWIADLPVIGALFKSTNFQKNQTELVILVTPVLINPTNTDRLGVPTENIRHASALEMLIWNRINSPVQNNVHLVGGAGFHIG